MHKKGSIHPLAIELMSTPGVTVDAGVSRLHETLYVSFHGDAAVLHQVWDRLPEHGTFRILAVDKFGTRTFKGPRHMAFPTRRQLRGAAIGAIVWENIAFPPPHARPVGCEKRAVHLARSITTLVERIKQLSA